MLFAQHLLNGLLAGAYYLLIALGLSLIFSHGGIVNLAHGAFYAIGAYLAVSIGDKLGFTGAALLSPLIVGVLGVAIERLLFRRFNKADHQMMHEMYTVQALPVAQVKNAYDIFRSSAPVPSANESLEAIATTAEENECKMA